MKDLRRIDYIVLLKIGFTNQKARNGEEFAFQKEFISDINTSTYQDSIQRLMINDIVAKNDTGIHLTPRGWGMYKEMTTPTVLYWEKHGMRHIGSNDLNRIIHMAMEEVCRRAGASLPYVENLSRYATDTNILETYGCFQDTMIATVQSAGGVVVPVSVE